MSLPKHGFLRNFAEYYPAFHEVSDAITGLVFIVNWVGLAEREIEETWRRRCRELQRLATRRDWEAIELKL
jgi:hypothetical protein